METRPLGPFDVPVVGLGCNNFGRRIGEAATREVVNAALDAGVRLFDTADVYGDGESERLLGRALGNRRDEVVIATKFGHRLGDDPDRGGAHPDWIATAVEDSLRRLDVETIDLYQLHRPDPDVPLAETLGALDAVVESGKARAIGCSNLSADQIDEAAGIASRDGTATFVSVQNRYSVLTREPEEDGVVVACTRHGLGLLPYFPLESGLLTGKYADGFDAADGRLSSIDEERRSRFADDDRLRATAELTRFAEQRGHTILELAISWLAAQDVVACVIPGATRPEQIRANVDAAGWEMSAAELAEVDRIVVSG